jgi:hypothetical protein
MFLVFKSSNDLPAIDLQVPVFQLFAFVVAR